MTLDISVLVLSVIKLEYGCLVTAGYGSLPKIEIMMIVTSDPKFGTNEDRKISIES